MASAYICPKCHKKISDKWYCNDCGELLESDYNLSSPSKEVAPTIEEKPVEQDVSSSMFSSNSSFDSLMSSNDIFASDTPIKKSDDKEKIKGTRYLIGGKRFLASDTVGALDAIYSTRNINYVFKHNSSKQFSDEFIRIMKNHLGENQYYVFIESFTRLTKSIDDRETIFVLVMSKLTGELIIKSSGGHVVKFKNKNSLLDVIVKTNVKTMIDLNFVAIYLYLFDDKDVLPNDRDIYLDICKLIFDYTGSIYDDGEVIYLSRNEEIRFGTFKKFVSKLSLSQNAYQKNIWLRKMFGDHEIEFKVAGEIPSILLQIFSIDIEHADSFLQNIRFMSCYKEKIYFEDEEVSTNKFAYISNSEQKLLSLAEEIYNERVSRNSHSATALAILYFLFRLDVFNISKSLFKSLGEYRISSYSVYELSKKYDFDTFVKEIASNLKPTTIRFLNKNISVLSFFETLKSYSPTETIAAVSSFMDDEKGFAQLAKIYNVKYCNREELQQRLNKVVKN